MRGARGAVKRVLVRIESWVRWDDICAAGGTGEICGVIRRADGERPHLRSSEIGRSTCTWNVAFDGNAVSRLERPGWAMR